MCDDMSEGKIQMPSSFPRFKELLTELRLAIWEYSLPGPRIVMVEPRIRRTETVNRVWDNKPNDIDNPAPDDDFFEPSGSRARHERERSEHGPEQLWIAQARGQHAPSILAVCRESHWVAAQIYTQMFGTPGNRPGIWFSSQHDTLYLGGDYVDSLAMDYCKHINFDGVKKLTFKEFNWGSTQTHTPMYNCVLKVLSWFNSLEEVSIVGDVRVSKHYEDLVFMDSLDVSRQVNYYSKPYSPAADQQLQTDEESFRANAARKLAADVSELTRLWKTAGQEYRSAIKALPKFERKIITTSAEQRYSEVVKNRYNEGRKSYRIRLLVTYLEGDPLEVIACHRTTIQDVAEQFREARGLSKELQILICRDGNKLDPAARLFDIANLSTLR